jgi:hypothetical protein
LILPIITWRSNPDKRIEISVTRKNGIVDEISRLITYIPASTEIVLDLSDW